MSAPLPAPTTGGRLLCVDIGNTRTVLGLFDGETPLEHWRVATDERRTADEWAAVLTSLFVGGGPAASLPAGLASLTGVAIAATVPGVLHEWRAMLERHLPDVPHVVVGPGIRTGVPVLMDNPREVGADRIANALAALTHHAQPGRPVVVVDLGTATTVEVVNAKGQYVGGLIAPGIEVSADALARRTAQLRRVELVRPRTVIARNTVEAIQSGLYFGVLAQVEGLLARVAREIGSSVEEVVVVTTGYLAPLVSDECVGVDVHDPWLTLRGLELIFRRNAG
ncbi:type III pantothenate kinase [Nocardioides zeae]|uniref:Type III pantothenate kinase n=1 Tax=Nocardioides imazamoxiresistens TaxID=3231893 RepID=A0ABU3PZM0_9ACTN|nr:type III pantothenate kinase [Nocardioides zeae]MDT9594713.1 type III pantothenate kinase [Nocardioides zeae]